MSKRDAPAMKLTVDDGRLVPASAWDQERLLTYRNRSTVNAYVTQDKPRWMERKYWSILDRVITTCGVKQRTSEDLHDHIKLKLGFVNAKFDDNGKLKVTLKSTKLMEDPEYEGYFNEAMGFLFELTGVDPLTLKKESADVGGEDEPESSDATPASPAMSDDGRDAHPDPLDGVAATSHSEGELDAGNGAGAPDDSGTLDHTSTRTLKGEVRQYFREVVMASDRGEHDECLIWPYTTDADGYAQMRVDGEMQKVQRLICKEIHGEPPTPDHQAAHSCGKGQLGCVTKGHLRWATRKENADDRVAHGTAPRGERNGRAKLTEPDVRNILALQGQMTPQTIAEKYGVDQRTVRQIHSGERWTCLARPDLGTAATPSSPAAERRECIDKMMLTVKEAADKVISPQEASAIIADSANWWIATLGEAHKPFVTNVFKTAKRVLRRELEPADAREYLESLVAA